MDLSIRVIALILCVTKVTSHQGTHTYRLSKLLKNHFPAAPSRYIRQQQRGKIMKNLLQTVKHFRLTFLSSLFPRNRRKTPPLQKRCALYRDLKRRQPTFSNLIEQIHQPANSALRSAQRLIAHINDVELSHPNRTLKTDHITTTRLDQGARQRRNPADATVLAKNERINAFHDGGPILGRER
jgi:hypothetical protein